MVLHSRSADPLRQQCEDYAKLMAVVIQPWVLLVSDYSLLEASPLDALHLVRTHATLLLRAFRQASLWSLFFQLLRTDLANLLPRQSAAKAPLLGNYGQALGTHGVV